MPTRAKKPCAYPQCPELVEAGNTYCGIHRKGESRRQDKFRTRDKRIKSFYSSARWQKVRNRFIKINPLCEHCLDKDIVTPAEEVDHIVPVKEDWSKRLREDNLQSLCRRCHRRKTVKDKELYG